MTETDYRLVNEEYAFSGPIRSVCIGPLGELVCGSQSDSPSVRRWKITPNNKFEEVGSQIFHDHWVVAVTSIMPNTNPDFTDGCIVTGCMDNRIRIFDPIGNPIMELNGHEKGVIDFSWTSDGRLISGSWDGTARVWDLKTRQCMLSLGPHENGVHVLGLPDGRIATTSTGESVNNKPANFKIRVWDGLSGQECQSPIQDHGGPIRAITRVAGCDGFATCSNDGSVMLRDSSGSVLGTMFHPPQDDGSPPFLFDVCNLDTPSGLDTASCGEDGTVCVWQGSDLLQCIQHPSSVWCVQGIQSLTKDGDFVTCSHDGNLRLFSRKRVESNETEERINNLNINFIQLAEESKRQKQRSNGPSQEEIDKAAKWEDRGSCPGKSEGQVKVFNKDNRLIATQWSQDSRVWIEIGEVTGSGDGDTLDGVQYDHVMPVEMDGPGGSTLNLKLGYNNLENPYDAAQRFIDKNELPQYHLKQIAEWVMARTGTQTPVIGQTAAAGGGGGRTNNAVGSSNDSTSMVYVILPVKAYCVYDEVPAGFKTKLIAKITEFNATIAAAAAAAAVTSSSTSAGASHTLSASDIDTLNGLVTTLENTSRYHASSITVPQLICIDKILSWSNSQNFPGLDLLRLVSLLHPGGTTTLSNFSKFRNFIEKSTNIIIENNSAASSLCAIRFLSNALKHEDLRKVVLSYSNQAIDNLLNICQFHLITNKTHSSKLIRNATSMLLLNLSIALNMTSMTSSYASTITVQHCINLISIAIEGILFEVENQELFMRYLLSAGTCLYNHRSSAHHSAMLVSTANQLGIKAKLNTLLITAAGNLDENAIKCIKETLTLL